MGTLKNIALVVMATIAVILIFAECENLMLFVAIKAIGFGMAYASYKAWTKQPNKAEETK